MPVPVLVSDPREVTAGWLTTVLEHAGALSDGRVDTFDATPIGTGSVGATLRYRLRYDGGTGPAAVVLKFASAQESSRAAGIATRSYENEVAFYRDLAGTVDVRRPRCYHAAIRPDTADVVVVLEDLSPAVQGDQLTGCDAVDGGLAVDAAARLHGPRWGDPGLLQVPWLVRESSIPVADVYRALWPGFADRYRDTLDPAVHEVGARLGDGIERWLAHPAGDRTITHGDFRIDNMLFSGAAATRELIVVDWQTVRLDCGTADVSYLLGGSLTTADRRAHEASLVRRYHQGLAGYGVRYPFEACWQDYRRHSWGGLVTAVIAAMLVGRGERSDAMFTTLANRHATQIRDLDAREFL